VQKKRGQLGIPLRASKTNGTLVSPRLCRGFIGEAVSTERP
jgi:hypothetical protein